MRQLETGQYASSMHKVADGIKSCEKFNQGSIQSTANFKQKYKLFDNLET